LPGHRDRAGLPPRPLPARRTPHGLRRPRPGAGRPAAGVASGSRAAGPGTGTGTGTSCRRRPMSTGSSTGKNTGKNTATEMLTALVRLREVLRNAPLALDTPGVEAHRTSRTELIAQLEDYVLPRLIQIDAPLLTVVGGSTG